MTAGQCCVHSRFLFREVKRCGLRTQSFHRILNEITSDSVLIVIDCFTYLSNKMPMPHRCPVTMSASERGPGRAGVGGGHGRGRARVGGGHGRGIGHGR